ncbi:UNKNOWN [Stylonychia lemnae]|uniref:Uncharacterized protein n=1 Tax=Stylonychia lemnae TaxID=5949 RepID=A0A078AUN7_STYLE|nr:UNKNOWN [Stylonychia lemnae]|eukprot:CDW84952.1 UNKNOWN [Stylonychia lemnae]
MITGSHNSSKVNSSSLRKSDNDQDLGSLQKNQRYNAPHNDAHEILNDEEYNLSPHDFQQDQEDQDEYDIEEMINTNSLSNKRRKKLNIDQQKLNDSPNKAESSLFSSGQKGKIPIISHKNAVMSKTYQTNKLSDQNSINPQGINRNYFNISNTQNNPSKQKDRQYSPSIGTKLTTMEKQYKPYYINSTYNTRTLSKQHKRKNNVNSTQVYEDQQSGKILIQSKVVRFTENGVSKTSTNRHVSTSHNNKAKQLDTIQNYPVPVGQQSIPNKNAEQAVNLLPAFDIKLQRDASAPKQISVTAAIPQKRIRLFNKVVMDFQDKYYRKKIIPNKILSSQEQLYDENIQLKYKINQQDQFIVLQKTQNKLLNNELEKQQHLLKQIVGASLRQDNADGSKGHNQQNEILIQNLKRELDLALKALAHKENDIKILQKSSKVTKFKEIDEERKMYIQESFRLHKIVRELITKGNATININSKRDNSIGNEKDVNPYIQNNQLQQEFMVRIQQYSSIINQQQNDVQALSRINHNLSQENNDLKTQDNQSQDLIRQLTQQIQELQHQKHQAELLFLSQQQQLEEKEREQQMNKHNSKQNSVSEKSIKQQSLIQTLNENHQREIERLHDLVKQKDIEITGNKQEQIENQRYFDNKLLLLEQQLQQIQDINRNQATRIIELETQIFGLNATIEQMNIDREVQKSMARSISEQHSIKDKNKTQSIMKQTQDIEDHYQNEFSNDPENQQDIQDDYQDDQIANDHQFQNEDDDADKINDNYEDDEDIFDIDYQKQRQSSSIVEPLEDTIVKHDYQKQENQIIQNNSRIQMTNDELHDPDEIDSKIIDNYGTLNNTQQTLPKVHDQIPLEKNDTILLLEEYKLKIEELNSILNQRQKDINEYNNKHDDQLNQITHQQSLIDDLQEKIINLECQIEELKISEEKERTQKVELNNKLADVSSQMMNQLREDMSIQHNREIKEKEMIIKELQLQSDESRRDLESQVRDLLQDNQIKEEQLINSINSEIDIVKAKLTRCFQILQIKDQKKLDKILNINSENSEQPSISEILKARFDLAQRELDVLSENILQVEELDSLDLNEISQLMYSIFTREILVYQDEERQEAFNHLYQQIDKDNIDIESFLTRYNIKTAIHQSQLRKVLEQYIESDKMINLVIDHLLNQSHNYSYASADVFERCLNKQLYKLQTQRSLRKNKSENTINNTYRDNNRSKTYKSIEHQEIKEAILEEEYKNAGDKLKLALEELQGNSDDNNLSLNEDLLQLNMGGALFSERSSVSGMSMTVIQPSQQKQPVKYLKNVQLQLIAQALNSKFINLRQHIKFYQTPRLMEFGGREVEVIKFDDLIQLLNKIKVLSYEEEDEDENQNQEMIKEMLTQIEAYFEIEILGQKVVAVERLMSGLKAFGYLDLQRPKSKRGFNFDNLDIKSIRILNRITNHCYIEVQKFIKQFNILVGQLTKAQVHQIYEKIMEQIVFKECLQKVLIKTKNKEEKCYLVQKPKFYAKLKQLGIKNSEIEYENLNQFLWLDSQYPDLILFKKLIKAVELVQINSYCASIGTKRIILEDATIVVKQKTTNKSNSLRQSLEQAQNSKQIQNPIAEEEKEEDGESYYDEEDDAKSEKKQNDESDYF